MKITFQAKDGKAFDCQKECKAHEVKCKAHDKLEKLVEDEVAYFDNQQSVLHFIEDNKAKLLEILKQMA